MIYLYSILGFSGLAAIIWIVRSLKDWGKAEIKKEKAYEERDEAKKEADILEKQRNNVIISVSDADSLWDNIPKH